MFPLSRGQQTKNSKSLGRQMNSNGTQMNLSLRIANRSIGRTMYIGRILEVTERCQNSKRQPIADGHRRAVYRTLFGKRIANSDV
jgi:hypothetical protein